ncbi:MAG TPA: LuxR C-terminal-related transcriptional regulator [Vicinamibacteria bacterium]|nr:LuxR C-terminal-related transcriptional regulator [Vicinamibacteria bacterium]
MRLFFWGIDGFVELHEAWQRELSQAMRKILRGEVWVPRAVMLAFIKTTKALLNAPLLSGHSLTAREGQVLWLLMRHLSNKEISSALGISERTAKFHVSNVLSKLQIDDRRGLSPDKLALKGEGFAAED